MHYAASLIQKICGGSLSKIVSLQQERNNKLIKFNPEITHKLTGVKIENMISNEPEIDQCMVYGDKKTYLVALIVSESEENKKQIEFYLQNLNKNLSLVEKVKKFKLIKEEFTIENGMLTPTLKLKRKEIIKNYKQQLENLY